VAGRELLLDAALRLFAERGVAGTTIAQIAAHAGLTPAMLHYYFRNRERLLDAIVAERLRAIVTAVWLPVGETSAVVPMLRGLVQRILTATEDNPWLPSLWLREVMSEGGLLRKRLIRILPLESVRHLIVAVTSAQRRGEVNPQLEPRLVQLSVIGLTLLPLSTIGIWGAIPLLKGVERRDIARHAEALLVGAFSKPELRHTRIAQG
jgi:AcrR family transcriptional regulator